VQEHRSRVLDDLPAPTIVALTGGLYAVALMVVPGWWGLTTLAALVAITVGLLQRRQATTDTTHLRAATLAMGAGVVGLVGGVGGFVIDDGGGSDVARCTEV